MVANLSFIAVPLKNNSHSLRMNYPNTNIHGAGRLGRLVKRKWLVRSLVAMYLATIRSSSQHDPSILTSSQGIIRSLLLGSFQRLALSQILESSQRLARSVTSCP